MTSQAVQTSFLLQINRILFLLFLLLLLFVVGRWLLAVFHVLRFPDQLDYGEGIIWQQTELIFQGLGYKSLNSPPYIVFHYPPLFHLVSGSFAKLLGLTQLIGGRLTSVVAALGIAAFVFFIVFRGLGDGTNKVARIVCSGTAALLLFSFQPFHSWSLFDRVDTFGIFLSLAGAYFSLRALEKTHYVVLSALLFSMGLFTKQILLIAPIATILTLFFTNYRLGIYCLCFLVFFLCSGFILLFWLTDGGFLVHTLFYNINRLELSKFHSLFIEFLRNAVLILVATLQAGSILFQIFRSSLTPNILKKLKSFLSLKQEHQVHVFLLFYYLLNIPFIFLVLKNGASYNYLIEWGISLVLLVGLFLYSSLTLILQVGSSLSSQEDRSSLRGRSELRGTIWSLLLFFQVLFLISLFYYKSVGAPTEKKLQQFYALVDLIRTTEKPVISDNMVAVLTAGKSLLLETAIITELTSTGLFQEQKYLPYIQNKELAFFITEGDIKSPLYNARYSPTIQEAMQKYYPVKEQMDDYYVWRPTQ